MVNNRGLPGLGIMRELDLDAAGPAGWLLPRPRSLLIKFSLEIYVLGLALGVFCGLIGIGASLTLHLHQVGWRTCTSELPNMPGTQRSRCAAGSGGVGDQSEAAVR